MADASGDAACSTSFPVSCPMGAIMPQVKPADHLEYPRQPAFRGSVPTPSTGFGRLGDAKTAALIAAGAVGDLLCPFLDAEGRPIDHP